MSEKHLTTFAVDLTKVDDWDAFNETMNEANQKMIDYTEQLASELHVSIECARSIVYLRGRSRHTQEKENELIRLDQSGEELPNVYSGDF